MRNLTIFMIFCFSTAGCASSPITMTPLPSVTETPASQPSVQPSTETPTGTTVQSSVSTVGWGISDVISIDQLSRVTGYTDYQYLTPDYDDPESGEPAGTFWSVYSAMLQIEFHAHTRNGLEELEDYRTAAYPGSLVWLESHLWDTGCFYQLDEWTSEIVAVKGDVCYQIAFVPSAYPQFSAEELGIKLMELFIQNHLDYREEK